MTELFKQIKWQFLIFQRNNLIAMIVGMTAFYVVIIYFLKDLGNIEKFITLLILNDPSLIGFMFIGLSIILDKDQEVLPALFVTPINHHYYLISRILILSGMSVICTLGMVLMAKGTSFNPIHFSIGTFSTCVVFAFLGIYVVSYTTDILHFVLRSVPLMILMSLPLLNYFEFTDLSVLKIIPLQGALLLIDNSYRASPNVSQLLFGYASILVWIPLLYWLVYRTFKSKMVNV